MEPNFKSLSSNISNVRQDVFPLGPWTITSRKGIIMQSMCTCAEHQTPTPQKSDVKEHDKEPVELCDICRYRRVLPHVHSMPEMLFKNNLLRLEHFTGVGIEFNPLDALKLVEETQDPLRVAVADGWQSARADCPFAKSITKPFDWTFSTNYKGTLLSAIKKSKSTSFSCINRSHFTKSDENEKQVHQSISSIDTMASTMTAAPSFSSQDNTSNQLSEATYNLDSNAGERLSLSVEETDERIDVNKLKVREEIYFYDEVTLFEDELADHGISQYTVKIRVMPSSLFILARFYLRVDGVLARINDTRIYHELNNSYMLREYTNREAKLCALNLPVSTVVNPSELMNHLPIRASSYEKLILPQLR